MIVYDCSPSTVERQWIAEGDQHFPPISPDSTPPSEDLPSGALPSETRDVPEEKGRGGGDRRGNACPELDLQSDSEGDDEDEEDEDEDDEGSERRIHSTEMDCEGQLAEGCARKGS